MMDTLEALALLELEMKSWRRSSYAELAHLVDCTFEFETVGETGIRYRGSVVVAWEDGSGWPLRVMGSIHHVGRRFIPPLADCFTVRPNPQQVASYSVLPDVTVQPTGPKRRVRSREKGRSRTEDGSGRRR
jgi:hypothetical protein